MSQAIVASFWSLVSVQESERVSSAKAILSELEKSQPSGQRQEDLGEFEDLQYVLKRLVSGLASSRKAARQGYATALAELFARFDCLRVDHVIRLMKDSLQVTGSAKGQETRDAYYGQVFALLALCRSGRLFKEDLLPDLKRVVGCLWELGKKKVYLKQISAKGIVDVIGQVGGDVFSQWILPVIREDLEAAWWQCTPERLSIAVAVQQAMGTHFESEFFKKQWKHVNVLHSKNYERIASVLMDSSYAHPQIHYVWDQILPLVLAQSATFVQFWKAVVDECLMTSSHERKYLGLHLVLKVVPKLTADQVVGVFCGNWMRCLMNNVTSPDKYLYSVAKHILNGLCECLVQVVDRAVHLAIVLQLLGPNGNRKFDQVSKTKTIATIVSLFDCPATVAFLRFLKLTFNKGKTVHSTGDILQSDGTQDIATRQWAIDEMLRVLRNLKLPQEDSWILDLGKFVFFHAYFDARDTSNGLDEILCTPYLSLSLELRQFCQQRFISVLSHVSHMPPLNKGSGGLSAGHHGTASDGEFWLYHLLEFGRRLLEQSETVSLHQPLSTESSVALEASMTTIQSIRQKASQTTSIAEAKAFELLFLYTTLQLFGDQDQSVEVLQDLQACYEKLEKSKSTGRKRKASNSSGPEWVEVLTDILLSYLARPSQLTRNIADDVFRAVVPHITKPALNLILQAVAAKKTRQKDQDDEDDEDEEEDDDEDDEDEEVSEDDEEVADSEKESNSQSDNSDVDEEFRRQVKAALGDCAAVDTSDDESDRIDDNQSDMSMDDDAMEAVDQALAAVFHERRLAKKDKKQRQEEKKVDAHFRLRALDLLDIFIKRQSSNPLILDLILPLLHLIRRGQRLRDVKPLVDRAENLFSNKLCKIKQYPRENVDVDNVHCLLEELLHIAQTAPSVNVVTLATHGCMFVVRVLRGNVVATETSSFQTETPAHKRKKADAIKTQPLHQSKFSLGAIDVDRFCNAYASSLRNFTETRNTRLHPVVFTELITRHPDVSWLLAKDLATALNTGVNNYRRTQACLMLNQLISNKSTFVESLFVEACPVMLTEFVRLLERVDVDVQLKTQQLRDVLRFGVKLVSLVKTHDCWVEYSANLNAAVVACQRSAAQSQDARTLCNKLLQLTTTDLV